MSRLFLALLLATAWLDAHAQSSLPPCPTNISEEWTDCLGTYVFSSGDKYSGEYKNGKHHGLGTYTWANGVKHVGIFKSGSAHGLGSLISSKGYTLVEGTWSGNDVYLNDMPWRYVAIGADGTDHHFVLTQSIRQDGALRRAWIMNALSGPHQRGKWLSVRALIKFDCADERYLLVTQSSFAGAFGTGEQLGSLGESTWEYVAPDTTMSPIIKYVCDHKLVRSK